MRRGKRKKRGFAGIIREKSQLQSFTLVKYLLLLVKVYFRFLKSIVLEVVVFIDGQRLLNHTGIAKFNEVEAVATASRAIYKEQIYILNDYFMIKRWTTGRGLKLADGLSCRPAFGLSIKLNYMIEKASLKTPYRLPSPHMAHPHGT
ncbi:hypothetical protein KEJ27_04520 [Candidatus Bathyarchaeota archaeon]|nr:hypothetical protein [Candidatus Bathyarchaeota archaeon]